MVVVEVLDKKFAYLKKTILQKARLLTEGNFYFEVYLVGDDFMKKNVLSFEHPKGFPSPHIKEKPLGEIYLNPKYIEEHGEDLIYMLIHGFTHLLGYDHIKKSDRIAMEKKEHAISRRIGHRISRD